MRSVYLSIVLSLALLPAPSYADSIFSAPKAPAKPLTVGPSSPDAAKPKDPNAFPQELIDERNQLINDYNALQKEKQGIETECDAARTPIQHTICNQKQQSWQTRFDAYHARVRHRFYKIDTWRRRLRGLPPEPETPGPAASANGQAPVITQSPGGKHTNSNTVLLPQTAAPVPANTY